LGLTERAAEVLDPSVMVPQVGQGAIGVECRADDERTRNVLALVDDPAARTEVEAERAYLARLGGGCDLPVGALARLTDGRLTIEGLLATPDGRVVLRSTQHGGPGDAHRLGVALAEALLAAGGTDLIDGGAP
jgi:hydroxymethylbilane synthase